MWLCNLIVVLFCILTQPINHIPNKKSLNAEAFNKTSNLTSKIMKATLKTFTHHPRTDPPQIEQKIQGSFCWKFMHTENSRKPWWRSLAVSLRTKKDYFMKLKRTKLIYGEFLEHFPSQAIFYYDSGFFAAETSFHLIWDYCREWKSY